MVIYQIINRYGTPILEYESYSRALDELIRLRIFNPKLSYNIIRSEDS